MTWSKKTDSLNYEFLCVAISSLLLSLLRLGQSVWSLLVLDKR